MKKILEQPIYIWWAYKFKECFTCDIATEKMLSWLLASGILWKLVKVKSMKIFLCSENQLSIINNQGDDRFKWNLFSWLLNYFFMSLTLPT